MEGFKRIQYLLDQEDIRKPIFFDDYDPELEMYNIRNKTMNRMRDNIKEIEREAFTSRLNRHQDHISAALNKNNMEDNKDLVKKLSLLDEDGLKAMDEHSRQSRSWVLEQEMFFLRGNYELEPKLDEVGHTNPEDDMVVGDPMTPEQVREFANSTGVMFNPHVSTKIDRYTEALMYSFIRDIKSLGPGSGLVKAPKFGVKSIKHD